MVSTSPDRTMVTSTSRPNATLRGKRTASLFPLRKVRLSATAIATSFVITRIYEISLAVARPAGVDRRAGRRDKRSEAQCAARAGWHRIDHRCGYHRELLHSIPD